MAVTAAEDNSATFVKTGYIGRIPVRNLWLLMLYASDLFRQTGSGKVEVEKNPDEIPNLVAELLTHLIERRLMRNLTYGYKSREAVLNRVRGRINLLQTERHQLLERGMVACRFEELTVDTPRNRFVRAALDEIAKLVHHSKLARRCRTLSTSLGRMGVVGVKPSRAEISNIRVGRHDRDDQQMIAAARLAFNLALPTEAAGSKHLSLPDREEFWVRRLFEKGVAGFYDVVLSGSGSGSGSGWSVGAGKKLNWAIESETPGIDKILPSMRTDIVLDQPVTGQRIIIDTKFNSISTEGWYREETLRSGYMYQIYAYLRSQEGNGDPLSTNASGLLLHPSVGVMVDESVVIQGHKIRFATVDLGGKASQIRDRLLYIVKSFDESSVN